VMRLLGVGSGRRSVSIRVSIGGPRIGMSLTSRHRLMLMVLAVTALVTHVLLPLVPGRLSYWVCVVVSNNACCFRARDWVAPQNLWLSTQLFPSTSWTFRYEVSREGSGPSFRARARTRERRDVAVVRPVRCMAERVGPSSARLWRGPLPLMGTRFVRQCAVGCWAGVDVLVAVADLFGTEELLVAGTREARWPGTF